MVMRRSTSSPVATALRTGDEGLIVEALRHSPDDVGQHGRSAVVEEALTILRTTPSSRVRNAAALIRTDLGADPAGESIIEVLRHPDVARSSGTLLFALNEVGASIPLSLLPSLVEHGSFEGCAEALIFMEEGRITQMDETGLQTARQTFENSLNRKVMQRAQKQPNRRSSTCTSYAGLARFCATPLICHVGILGSAAIEDSCAGTTYDLRPRHPQRAYEDPRARADDRL